VRVRVRVRGRPFASLLHRVSEGEGGWMCEGVLVARMQDDNLYLCLYLRGSSPIMTTAVCVVQSCSWKPLPIQQYICQYWIEGSMAIITIITIITIMLFVTLT